MYYRYINKLTRFLMMFLTDLCNDNDVTMPNLPKPQSHSRTRNTRTSVPSCPGRWNQNALDAGCPAKIYTETVNEIIQHANVINLNQYLFPLHTRWSSWVDNVSNMSCTYDKYVMGTWFAFIIFPCVASIQHWCVPRSVTLNSQKKLRVSERGLCIAQGRLRSRFSLDRSSLIFSGFPK